MNDPVLNPEGDALELVLGETYEISDEGGPGRLVVNGPSLQHLVIAKDIHNVNDASASQAATIDKLKQENVDATAYINQIEKKMNTLSHQMLTLETKNSSGRKPKNYTL